MGWGPVNKDGMVYPVRVHGIPVEPTEALTLRIPAFWNFLSVQI